MRLCVLLSAGLTFVSLSGCPSDGGSVQGDTRDALEPDTGESPDVDAEADGVADTSSSADTTGDDAPEGGCVAMVEDCLPELTGVTPAEACTVLSSQAGDCVATLVAAYRAEGCLTSCPSLPLPGLASLCGEPACEPVRAVLAGQGILTDECDTCACEPRCDCRECGDDGCGGSCGDCEGGESCSATGQCGEGGVSCAEATSACDAPSPDGCLCDGCVNDGVCVVGEEDCTCLDCRAEAACTGGCVDDGVCDPASEACACADCADHPVCNRIGYRVQDDDGATTATVGACSGTQNAHGCPAGQVAVGLNGRAGAWIDRVGLDCRAIGLGGYLSGPVTSADPLGTSSGGAALDPVTCPDGTIMVGATVKHGDAIDSLTPLCEPIALALDAHCPAPATRFGGDGGSATDELLCPDGYVVTAIVGPESDYPCALGLGCSRVTPADPDLCSTDGASCAPTAVQEAPWVCVDLGDGIGTCARTCEVAADCPIGRWCGDAGHCLVSECDGFYSPDACGDGQKCAPVGPGAYACVDNGDGAALSTCAAPDDCGAGLLCIDDRCAVPECDPAAAGACEAGETCVPVDFLKVPTDFGRCARLCTAFVDGACPEGSWCRPTQRDEASGAVTGECVPSGGGETAAGEACTSAASCLDGSGCIDFGAGRICAPLCDAEAEADAPGSCAAGSWCAGLVSGGEPLVYGACAPGCVPFVDAAESGCDAGMWCAPGTQDLAESQCVSTTGTAPEAARCGDDLDASGAIDDDERCGPGLFCIGFSGGARCALPCDPAAGAEDAGYCSNVSGYETCTCAGLTSGGVPLAIGIVDEGCVYDHGAPRQECESWGTCVAGELYGASADRCVMGVPALDAGADCTAAGLQNNALCAPFGACIDSGDGMPICRYMCASSAGELGSATHPDCPENLGCVALVENTEFGICLPN